MLSIKERDPKKQTMFSFRKKTPLIRDHSARRKRGGFSKKPVSKREPISSVSVVKETPKSDKDFSFLYGFLWTVFFGVAVFTLFFSPFLRLERIDISGVSTIPEDIVRQIVMRNISGTYFGAVPKNGLLSFPRSALRSDILDELKKVRSVDIEGVFPHTLSVHIDERVVSAIWCADERCFWVDENGDAFDSFDRSRSDSEDGGIVRIIDTSSQSVENGETLLDPDFTRFVGDIRDRLREFGIATETEYSTPSRFSDQLSIRTDEGWLLYVDARLPADQSVKTLSLLFQKEISEERRKHLKYVDLRTENRVYYSVEGESVSAPEKTEDSSSNQPSATVSPNSEATTSGKEKK